MRKMILVVTAVMFALGLGWSGAMAADKKAPEGPITVTNYGKKDPAQFDHGKHKDIKCEQCHHKGLEDPSCGNCHKEDDTDAPSIKDAFHKKGMGVCYDCHREKDSENYMKCADCHK